MFGKYQNTIQNSVKLSGIGIHTGEMSNIVFHPAKEDSGVIFKRIDQDSRKNLIKAHYKNVCETNFGTVISNEYGVKVSTIEHLMAALWGARIDNIIIEIDNYEVPIMDGSAEPFTFLFESCGIETQKKARNFIKIEKSFKIKDKDKSIEVSPSDIFSLNLEIDFDHPKIGKQNIEFHPKTSSFKNNLARAKTFGFESEFESLKKNGYAKGGSLNNAIFIGEKDIINKNMLRYKDEFVRHKALDFIGDIYLAGGYILGDFIVKKTGHKLNNKFLRKLFKDDV